VNLECRSEMCCSRLAANTGRKKVAKNRHLGTIAQLCQALSSQLRHVSTIGKKLVKQQYLLHMSPQYGELRPTSCVCWQRLAKSARRPALGRRETPADDDDDDDDDDVGDDVAGLLTTFWEQRVKIWRANSDTAAQSHAAGKV